MKLYKLKQLQQKRQFVAGRLLVGIDPAKAKHEAQILNTDGLPLGSSFSFPTTYTGYNERLWRGLQKRLPATLAALPRQKLIDHLIFAVEASCNLWPTLVAYLEAQHGRVVMVSPLSTCHARPAKSGDFSRTDTKDAFLIADLARQGTFHFRERYTSEQQAMHRLAITYDKLRKDLQRCRARLRAQVETIFPEFARRLKPLAASRLGTCSHATLPRTTSLAWTSRVKVSPSCASRGTSTDARPSSSSRRSPATASGCASGPRSAALNA